MRGKGLSDHVGRQYICIYICRYVYKKNLNGTLGLTRLWHDFAANLDPKSSPVHAVETTPLNYSNYGQIIPLPAIASSLSSKY